MLKILSKSIEDQKQAKKKRGYKNDNRITIVTIRIIQSYYKSCKILIFLLECVERKSSSNEI